MSEDSISGPQQELPPEIAELNAAGQNMHEVLQAHQQSSAEWITRLESEHAASPFRRAGRWLLNNVGVQTPTQRSVEHHQQILDRDITAESTDHAQSFDERFGAGASLEPNNESSPETPDAQTNADKALIEVRANGQKEIDDARAKADLELASARTDLQSMVASANDSVLAARREATDTAINSLRGNGTLTAEAEAVLLEHNDDKTSWAMLKSVEHPEGSIEDILVKRGEANFIVYSRMKRDYQKLGVNADAFNELFLASVKRQSKP